MPKINKIIIGLVLWCCSYLVYAAALTATVENTDIVFGENIHLTIRLADAVANEPLDLSPLAKDFMIYSQQQYSAYNNNNGQVTTDIGWRVTLMPKKNGQLVIPELSLDTSKGKLSSQPINITVQQATAGNKRPDTALGISLVATVNKNKAYVNEPVIYTIKVISYKPLAKIVLDDIKSNEAMIEKLGDANQYEKIIGGVSAHIIEIKYAVTGIKPGKTIINPAFMHGELQIQAPQTSRPQRFGLFNDLFLNSMVELKPFSLQSEEIVIDVMPLAVKDSSILPMRNLQLTEKWDGVENVHVGDTIMRKIKLVANGSFANQLPNLKDYVQATNIKVYASKPILNDKVANENVIGTKEEEYSLIPQQPGVTNLPEVKVKWWNVVTNKAEVATLPAKTLNILPAINNTMDNTVDFSTEKQQNESAADVAVSPKQEQKNLQPLWLAVIGLVVGIILTITGIYIYTRIKKRLIKKTIANQITNTQEKTIETAADLRISILNYAIKNWRLPTTINLNNLPELLTQYNYNYDFELYTQLYSLINLTIYTKKSVNIEQLVCVWENFQSSVSKNKRNKHKDKIGHADYSTLNPT